VVDKIYQVEKNNLFYLILLHITISFLLFSFCLSDFKIKFKIVKMEEETDQKYIINILPITVAYHILFLILLID